jgi:hypothetical protein
VSARTHGFAIVTACAALLAAEAKAVDGEILIDQARVNAGAITPGDAPGFPATLSRAGRYKLNGTLSVPAERNGIEVTQDNVTIDLNGFTIVSNPSGEAFYGVFAANVFGLRIINGTIAGFENAAIANVGGARLVVENMRLVNGSGVFGGTESRILNSTIANGTTGIVCPGCLIEQNVITGNTSFGISIPDGGGQVLGNVIVGNGNYGISTFAVSTGYGNNILFGNAGGGAQVAGPAIQLHPNVCEPACPLMRSQRDTRHAARGLRPAGRPHLSRQRLHCWTFRPQRWTAKS